MTAPFDLAALEKLEALHAAATPGEWTGDRHDGTVKYRLHSENCNCDREEPWSCSHLVLSVDHKNVTSGFLGARSAENEKLVMALHNAFPDMAKALREAWEISKCRRDEGLDWVHAAFDFQRERDEARAEAAAARAELAGEDTLRKAALDAQEAMAALRQELTEARDEVARLREAAKSSFTLKQFQEMCLQYFREAFPDSKPTYAAECSAEKRTTRGKPLKRPCRCLPCQCRRAGLRIADAD